MVYTLIETGMRRAAYKISSEGLAAVGDYLEMERGG